MSGKKAMRRIFAVLIILTGASVLILARIAMGPDPCDPQPSFFERGTFADCAARNQKADVPGYVASATPRDQ